MFEQERENLDQDGSDAPEEEVIVPEVNAVAIPTDEVRVPAGMDGDEATKLQDRARELVEEIARSGGSQEMGAIDSISNTGIQTQRNAGSELNLLRGKVGDMLTRGGPAGDLSKDMADLRLTLNEINPHEFEPGGVLGFLKRLPLIGGRANALVRSLEKMAIKYEPVSKQVTVIEHRLRDGRSMLAKDNIELRKLYEQVETQVSPLQNNAYLGELLMRELTELSEKTNDPAKREKILGALHDVAMRVQDLRTMEEVYAQYFVSIEMTRQNNNRLGQAVERTLALGTSVITVGLAIQMGLARQKRVMEATERTREFLGNMVAANASAIKRHTEEIGDMFNNPVIAIEKITQAHDDLVTAIDTANRLREEGVATARENISRLAEMSDGLQQKLSGVGDEARPALEA